MLEVAIHTIPLALYIIGQLGVMLGIKVVQIQAKVFPPDLSLCLAWVIRDELRPKSSTRKGERARLKHQRALLDQIVKCWFCHIQ